jgi:hemolysin activation/secretion protein
VYFVFQRFIISSASLVALANFTPHAIAQSAPPPGVNIPPQVPERIEQTTPTPSDRIPPPIETTPLPPDPNLQIPTPTPETPPETPPSGTSFFVQSIQVLGNTVLQDQVRALVQQYENRQVTFEELLELRSKITQLYVDNGYITSGAFLPNNQVLSDGIVEIQVVEGELERIELSGLNRLRQGYIRSRLELATKPPLNRQRIEEALQLLQLDPLLERVNAELTAGSTPGRSILIVNLREAPAFHLGVELANRQSPSIGSLEVNPFISHDNLLGFGDRLSGEYVHTEGLDLYDLGYTIPFNPRNGTISLRFSDSDSRIIEDDFEDLEIRSETRSFSIGVRQPIHRSPQSEFALGLSLDLRRNQTFLLEDIPFSFSEGPEDGESKVTVLRFSQDWVDRGARRILAARSQFSLGLDLFDSTVNDTGTDGRFFSWLGQFQWVQQLPARLLLLTRVDAQLTPDSLLPLERFSIGGVDTLRGYRQNELVADNGILGSVELRIPLTANPSILQLTPFFEIGTVWNNETTDPDPSTIAGLGLGLRWAIRRDLFFRLDYGIPLIKVDDRDNSLQSEGIYFSIRYQPF